MRHADDKSDDDRVVTADDPETAHETNNAEEVPEWYEEAQLRASIEMNDHRGLPETADRLRDEL